MTSSTQLKAPPDPPLEPLLLLQVVGPVNPLQYRLLLQLGQHFGDENPNETSDLTKTARELPRNS